MYKFVNGKKVAMSEQDLKDREALQAEKPNIITKSKIKQIKNITANKISEVVPIWKQLNLVSRAIELNYLDRTIGLTTDEQTELTAILTSWKEIKRLRTVSNQEEQKVQVDYTYNIDEINWNG